VPIIDYISITPRIETSARGTTNGYLVNDEAGHRDHGGHKLQLSADQHNQNEVFHLHEHEGQRRFFLG
jgi:hypothetical protein